MTYRFLARLLTLAALLISFLICPHSSNAAMMRGPAHVAGSDLTSVGYLAQLPAAGHVRFVRSSNDGQLLFVGLSSGPIARSADGGRTWVLLRTGVPGAPGASMLDLQIAASDSHIVWATGLTGVYRSQDAGLTWAEADVRTDVPGRAVGSVLAIDPRHPEAAYLAGYRNGGMYRTGDGGLTWQQVLAYPVSGVSIEPSSGSIIYAVSYTGGLQRSSDHGHTWTKGNHLPAYAGIGEETASPGRLLALDGAAGGLYVGLDGGMVLHSVDGGLTWQDFSLGLPRSTPGQGYSVPYTLAAIGGIQPRLLAIVPSGLLGAQSGGELYSRDLTSATATPPTAPGMATVTATASVSITTALPGATQVPASGNNTWQQIAVGADFATAGSPASGGYAVALEATSALGYPAYVSGADRKLLYSVPYVLPAPLARTTARGFAFGLTPVSYVSGVNYEGPNDRPWQLWQDGKFDPSLVARDFDNAASAGYKVVRVFVQDPLPQQVLAGQFGHLDTMVALARQRDLRLLITFNDSRSSDMTFVKSVDRSIAAHYVGNPTIFGYDLQNEPGFQDIAGAIYPPGVTLPLLSDEIIKRYGEHVSASKVQKDRAAGKWRGNPFGAMSERQVYLYLNAASILDDYFSANPSAADQAPGSYWGPLVSAVNASLAIYIHQQLDAVRAVDNAHLVTIGYNKQFWAALPANEMLDFRSIHLYPTSQDFTSVHGSLLNFEDLLAGARTPQVLGEYGYSTAFQSSSIASVQETAMSLYLRVLGGSGDFKWQLNDDTVGFNPYENGLGLFGAGNAPKVSFYIAREINAYLGGPHQPGGVRMWRAAGTGIGYLYSAADGLGISGGSYADSRVTYQAHNNAASAQVWLDWATPGRLRMVSTHEADITLNLPSLTGALTGTIAIAPALQSTINGMNLHVHMFSGLWYTITFTPGGTARHSITLPAPARRDGWYILATGHNVAPPFLTRWLALGGIAVAGAPFAEAQAGPDGLTQYYESLALHVSGPLVRLLPLGEAELGGIAPPARELPKKKPHSYFKSTGHNLQGAFKAYWLETGGENVWGPPISEEFKKSGITVQYFVNAEFVWDGATVNLGSVGLRAWAKLQVS